MTRHQPHPLQREGTALFVGLLAVLCVGIFLFSKHFLRNFSAGSEGAIPEAPFFEQDVNQLPYLSVADIWLALGQEKNVLFLDIRDREKFTRLHVAQSLSVPLDEIPQYTPDPERPVFVVFDSDQAESLGKVAEFLTKHHVSHFFVSGGFETLQNEHYPLVSIGDPSLLIDQSKVTPVTPEEAKQYAQAHPETTVALDIRSMDEFAISHIHGAINIPLQSLEARSTSLSRMTTYLLYGDDTLSVFQAAVRLSDLNFPLVKSVDGTLADMEKIGFPIERGVGAREPSRISPTR